MQSKHYNYSVSWLPVDHEHLGLCAEFPSLSWLAKTPEAALEGIGKVVEEVVADMPASGEALPPNHIQRLNAAVSTRKP